MKGLCYLIISIQLFSATFVLAEDTRKSFREKHNTFLEQHRTRHEQQLIRSRAMTKPDIESERAVYQYTEITDYRQCAEQNGNLVADASLNNVYNVTIVRVPSIIADKCAASIGNIVNQGDKQEIVNYVDVYGDIDTFWQSVDIGNIFLQDGEVHHIRNSVTVEGRIQVR